MRGWVLSFGLLVAGCGTSERPISEQESQALRPENARLAALYEQSCKSCHTVKDSGAPLAGDKAAWQPRMAKGRAVLERSIQQGLNGMPAGGQCFACSPVDRWALTEFMSGKVGN